MYAIVDIETTGSYAAANGITEISIHIFDGIKVVEKIRDPGQSRAAHPLLYPIDDRHHQ